MPFPAKTDREKVLSAAVEELRRVGQRELSLRRVAAILSVAPNAIYRYFSNKQELEGELAREGARRMLTAMQKTVGRHSGERAIRGIADSYLRFAREEPELYDMMLRPKSEKSAELWHYCLQRVSELSGPKRAASATFSLWALLHGTADLRANLPWEGKPHASSLRFGLDAWVREAARRKEN